MILGARRQNNAPGDGKIEFPRMQSWNPMTKVATVAADVDRRRVLCRISGATLLKKFPETDDAMKAVVDNRMLLETAARKLIESKAFEEDGSIVIQYKDL